MIFRPISTTDRAFFFWTATGLVGQIPKNDLRESHLVTPCPSCGAVYLSAEDSCAKRFEALLALDHSRVEPWGSRHALAFSAFALQHADRFSREVLQRAWLFLFSVYEIGSKPGKTIAALRSAGTRQPDWDVPALPSGKPDPPFDVTIADLGSFPAETYASQLDLWCQAALDGWSALLAVTK